MKKCTLLLFLVCLAVLASAKNILIYGPRLVTSPPNEQSLAVAAGHTVTVVTAAQWTAMTTAQFAAYDAIIIPDNGCTGSGGNSDGDMTVLNANKSTWSPAVTGRVVLIGGDLFLHRDGKYQQLATNAINYVANGGGPGLFFITSCTYFNHYSNVPINFLSNVLTVNSIGGNCPGGFVVTAPAHPVMSGITAADLGSACNSHNQFGGFGTSATTLVTAGGNAHIIASDPCAAPSFTACPSNLSANTTATSCDASVSYTATATGSNPISYSYSFSGATTGSGSGTGSGSSFNQGVTTVTVTATNICGAATCSFTVTVNDNVAPTITCPNNIVVNNAQGQCGAVVSFPDASVVDNCSVCNPTTLAGYTYLGKYNGHSYFVSNAQGQWAAFKADAESLGGHLATVTSQGENDFIASKTGLIAWIGLTDQATEGSFQWVTGEPVVYTNWCAAEPNNGPGGNEDWALMNWSCVGGGKGWNDGSNNVCCPAYAIIEFECGSQQTSGPASGSFFPVGTTTVTYSAMDNSGNSSTCSFTVTVNDNEAPAITCPGTATVDCQGSQAPSATGTATATDNCTPSASISIAHSDGAIVPGSCAGNYSFTRTWTATDASNNSSSCTQTIIVQDVSAPSLTGAPYAGSSGTDACMADAAAAAPFSATQAVQGYTDNCSGPVTATLTNTSVAGSDCAWTVTYTFSVSDACGNTLPGQSYSNTGSDQQAPTLSGTPYGGSSGTSACAADAPTAAAFSPNDAVQGYSDNCGGAVSATLTNTTVTGTDCSWTVTYTYSVSDACGNTLPGQSYSNTGGDQTPPTAVCKSATVTLSNGTASITPADVFDNSSSDNCGQVTPVSVTPATFSCADAGDQVPVTLTVRDDCGNTSTCTTTVYVVGAEASCTISSNPTSGTYTDGNPRHIYLGYGTGTTMLIVNPTGGSSFSYQWSGPGLSCSTCANPVFTPTAGGNYSFTVIVENEYGCKTSCDITICVIDIRVPGQNGKVYICHVPSGNPSAAQTLSVNTNAVAAHLNNHAGDKLGACDQTCAPGARMISGNGSVVGDEVKVYPNPTNGTFIVELPYIEDQARITVTDVAGKTIQSQVVRDGDGNRLSFDLSTAARGVYFVEVSYGDQRFRTKLVVR